MFEIYNKIRNFQMKTLKMTEKKIVLRIICIVELTKIFKSGYCCIQWMVCSDSYSFNFNTAGIAIYTSGNIGTNCALDYLVIESKILK